MYKRMTRILPVAAIFTLAACQGNTSSQTAANSDSLLVDSLQTEVISLHDEGMTYTMAIRRLTARTAEVADSLEGKKADATAYRSANALLDSANREMNTWMHTFDLTQEGKTLEEKKAYLEAEKKKMTDIKALMEKSVQEAKALLKEE
ncbi:hypothetical protein [Chitinophaga sp. XS-30]|uniref:hypothetical protein n=1 Tax=Chitinophaga sp. XS-30 TaxID=2604421 RepID=UPI0011DC8CB4|nr:hypothetical protein [Chitinophaga sp. XS-30]QEH40597.1 hypothetical protein FW415_06800 [Chitinophaga sp. XS-30]